MQITFHGAAGVVTGSCFLVETAGRKLLVDCGLFQGTKALQARNYESFPFNPADIDAVLLTHAHIDHSGLLPKLVRLGYSGPIYATHPTRDLLRIMLPDSAHIQESEVERLNRKRARQGEPPLSPIYTTADAYKTVQQVVPVDLETPIEVFDSFVATFSEAGHVLGAAMITVVDTSGDEPVSVAFTGDIGPDSQTLLNSPSIPGPVQYVVMESTYGNRSRRRDENRYDKLAEIVRQTLARNGNVIIPAFAIGRTQELLYALHRLVESGELDPGRIFLDSPLAIEATEIFCSHVESFDEEVRHFAQETEECPFYLKELTLSRTAEESMAINRIRSGAVIISASGMCEAGRIKHHLRHNLWREECSVVFVGYQAEGTLGRRIVQGDPVVRIHGEQVRVRAHVYSLEGFSAHADQSELIEWVSRLKTKPRHVFLVHGEDDARSALQKRLVEQFGLDVSMPGLGDTVTLTSRGIADEVAATPTATDGETLALWHSVEELRRLVDALERSPVAPSDQTKQRLIDAVNEALRRAQEAVETVSR